MGGTKNLKAIHGWLDRAYAKYRFIKSREDHTGGGDGDQLQRELEGLEKDGKSDNGFSEAVCDVFRDCRYYELFDKWYALTSLVNIHSNIS
jgi:hypothetical protein